MLKQGKTTSSKLPRPQESCQLSTCSMLSNLLESTLIAHHSHTTYQFYMMYFKFGQLQPITIIRITLNSTHLDLVIADKSKLLGASFHLGMNFVHHDPCYSIFWRTQPTFDYVPPWPNHKEIPSTWA